MTRRPVIQITPEIVVQIVQDWNQCTVKELAENLGISQMRLKSIARQLNREYQRPDGSLVCPPRSSRRSTDAIEEAARSLGLERKPWRAQRY